MANGYSVDDLLHFLSHASDKGLMPAATATALGVASRNILGILDGAEREDVRKLDIEGVIRRFNNKRARDFSPASLKEYGRRVQRALGLFTAWKEDPANFTVRTRASGAVRRKDRSAQIVGPDFDRVQPPAGMPDSGGYQSAFPVRPGTIVTIANIPADLTAAEAERLAAFIRMLVSE